MQTKRLPLEPAAILVNTRTLADRWSVNSRTVLRICRHYELTEIKFLVSGRILFLREEIETLEAKIFRLN